MTSPDSFATFHVKGKLTMTTELTLCQRLDNAVTERNLLLIRGAVPGSEGGQVIVRPSVKAARLAKRKTITPTKAAAPAKGAAGKK